MVERFVYALLAFLFISLPIYAKSAQLCVGDVCGAQDKEGTDGHPLARVGDYVLLEKLSEIRHPLALTASGAPPARAAQGTVPDASTAMVSLDSAAHQLEFVDTAVLDSVLALQAHGTQTASPPALDDGRGTDVSSAHGVLGVLKCIFSFGLACDDIAPAIRPSAQYSAGTRWPTGLEEDNSHRVLGDNQGGAEYDLRERLGQGHYGEVWKAVRADAFAAGDMSELFVLKRMFVERGGHVLYSGLREAHFGRLLRHAGHVARFMESFERAPFDKPATGRVARDLWLVFRYEGRSLGSYFYEADQAAAGKRSFTMFRTTRFWTHVKTHPMLMKEIIRQLLVSVSECHSFNVTHRDIKPDNVLLAAEPGQTPTLRLADFGSAVDAETLRTLYPEGPSLREQTRAYSPPETLFNPELVYYAPLPHSYDMWSVGVVWLEMLLGTSQVFELDPRTQALLDQKLKDATTQVRASASLLRAFTEYCIYPPSAHHKNAFKRPQGKSLSASERGVRVRDACTEADLQSVLVRRDPMGVGFEDEWGRLLLLRLLQWNPAERVEPARALQHAYFTGAHACDVCGETFEFADHLTRHKTQAHNGARPAGEAATRRV